MDLEAAYAAGIIDGEGATGGNKRNGVETDIQEAIREIIKELR